MVRASPRPELPLPPTFASASSRFYKLDLHVHTPHSLCYEDHMRPELRRRTSLEEIVAAALAAGLEGMAVTDHNSVENVNAMRLAAAGTPLVLFPGFEVSAQGGHVLGIFDSQSPTPPLRELLLSLGFTPEHFGDGFSRTDLWMDQVCERIGAAGGVVIAAHVDREPRGFLASDLSAAIKRRIYQSPALSALEVTDPSQRSRWNQATDPLYPLPRACIQSSDAHAPEEVGRRPIYLRLSSLTLSQVQLALQDYTTCVRFPQELEGETLAAT